MGKGGLGRNNKGSQGMLDRIPIFNDQRILDPNDKNQLVRQNRHTLPGLDLPAGPRWNNISDRTRLLVDKPAPYPQ